MDWLPQVYAIGPELLLILGGMLVLTFDIVIGDDQHPLLPGLTGLILLAALVWSFFVIPEELNLPGGVAFGMFAIDHMTYFFRVFALITGLFVLALTINYIKGRSRQTGEFYSFLIFITLAVIATSAANNLILIYLAFEFLSLTSYIMVGWLRHHERSNEAAMKYLLYGAVSSAVMLYGMSLLYGATGTTNLHEIAAAFTGTAGIESQISGLFNVGIIAAVLIMVGLGFKVALVPFHQWSPDAYEGAPTPVTTFLAVGPKAAGFAMMIRVLGIALAGQIELWQPLLSTIAILTMVIANITALVQTDIKRLLAYSSIAQAGYILMGLAANNPANNLGFRATLLYLLAYLFTNVGLFVAVIAYEEHSGSTKIEDYKGLLHRAPFLAIAMFIFFLSLLGIPPTAGFLGKFFVFEAAIRSELYVLAIVGVLTSVISAYYYLNVVRQMFFASEDENATPVTYPWTLKLTVGISLAATLLMNIFPMPFLELIGRPTELVTEALMMLLF